VFDRTEESISSNTTELPRGPGKVLFDDLQLVYYCATLLCIREPGG
jgi:hypothetical protein